MRKRECGKRFQRWSLQPCGSVRVLGITKYHQSSQHPRRVRDYFASPTGPARLDARQTAWCLALPLRGGQRTPRPRRSLVARPSRASPVATPTPELGRKIKQGTTCSNAHAGAWSKDQAGHHHPRRSLVARPSRASVNVTVCLRLVERPSWAVAILTHAEYPPAWPTCVPPQGECVKRTTQFTTLIHPTADHVLALVQATACHSLVVPN